MSHTSAHAHGQKSLISCTELYFTQLILFISPRFLFCLSDNPISLDHVEIKNSQDVTNSEHVALIRELCSMAY